MSGVKTRCINLCSCRDRLRKQLLSTWQSLLHVAKNDARNCLSEYLHSQQFQHVSAYTWLSPVHRKLKINSLFFPLFFFCVVLASATIMVNTDSQYTGMSIHCRRHVVWVAVYRAVKCRLIWHFRGQALLLRVLHIVACDNVRDCVFLTDDLNRVKKGLNSYELNFSLPTNSQNKLTELN